MKNTKTEAKSEPSSIYWGLKEERMSDGDGQVMQKGMK